MTKSKEINFRINAIHVLNFNFKNPLTLNLNIGKGGPPIEAKLNINYKWDIDKDLFGVLLNYIFFVKNKDGSYNELLKMEFLTEFHIKEMKKVLIVRSGNDFDIDEGLESTLVSIAISTGRGILYEKVSGTNFQRMIYPLINPMDVILSKKLKSKK